jgi:hypothetical protein
MSKKLDLHIRTGKHGTCTSEQECIQDVIPKAVFIYLAALGYVISGITIKKDKKGLTTPRARIPRNGAQTATQSGIGAELGESPGHGSEVEAFN